jgi:hypothetical protein
MVSQPLWQVGGAWRGCVLRLYLQAIIDVGLCTQDQTRANISAALEVGQLVKDEYFTLFESIGAIEVPISPF